MSAPVRLLALAAALGVGVLPPGGALALAPATDLAAASGGYADGGYGASGRTVRVDLASAAGASRSLTIPKGKSAVVELPVDAKDVVVSDPGVADVVLSTPRRIYILGVGPGQTDAGFFDASGRQIMRLNVRVDQDVSAFSETLNRILPGSHIQVEAVNSSIVLSGEVPNNAAADKAIRLAGGFVRNPNQVVNMLSVADSEQVMLKVRVIEVNRAVIKQLGFNLSALIGTVGGTQFLASQAATWGVNGSLLGGLAGGYQLNTQLQPELAVPCLGGVSGTCYQIIKQGSNTFQTTNPVLGPTGTPIIGPNGVPETYTSTNTISNPGTATALQTVGSHGLNQAGATIDAFEQVGLVRTLAEPNLTAVSGESAKFLVGGEFPVPVGQDSTGRITVEFKQYGVGLGFTPIVLSKDRISLKLSSEVSEITNTGAFTLQGTATTGNGAAATTNLLTIPGLNVRRAETTVELPSGQSLMIAGLIQSVSKQTLSSLPGLMQVPVLGALFRSRDFQEGETELVVIITPYLVKPAPPGVLQTPADGLLLANDLETNLLGKLNKSSGHPLPVGQAYQGPFGYVVE